MHDSNNPFDQFHYTRLHIELSLADDNASFNGSPSMPAVWYDQSQVVSQGNQSNCWPFAIHSREQLRSSAFRLLSPEEVKTQEVNCIIIQN